MNCLLSVFSMRDVNELTKAWELQHATRWSKNAMPFESGNQTIDRLEQELLTM
jgi:hypothetical protein